VSAGAAELGRARFARVQAAMARHGVGSILVASPHLGAFASGARRVQVAGSGGGVPWVVINAGAPAAVVFTPDPDGAGGNEAEALCWSRDAQLARIAALVAQTEGAVACDVFAPFLPSLGRRLVDAAPLLAEAAAPRSKREVAAIAGALAAARTGLEAALGAVHPGATPAAVIAGFSAAMSRARAGFPLGEGSAWREGVRLAPDDVFDAGDLLAFELGLFVAGHAGVAGDTVACGDADLGGARRRWSEALCALAKRCRAGATTADLRAAASAAGATQFGLLAHGLGVGVEPPFVDLRAEDAAPLHSGTILVLAPVVDGFRATRALLVTEGAARWLEAAP